MADDTQVAPTGGFRPLGRWPDADGRRRTGDPAWRWRRCHATGVTQVGGVILIAHGADTFIAGFRSIHSRQVQRSFTQQGASAAATKLGASEQTAAGVGTVVDLAAGLGPSVTITVALSLRSGGPQTRPNVSPSLTCIGAHWRLAITP